MNRRLILALAPATLALAAVAAHAQSADHPPMMHGPPTVEMKARHEAMMKQHAEDLKTILRLRPDQEPALAALMAAHHPPEMHEPPEPNAQTTPERLDEMAKRDAARAAEHAKMREALGRFYAALSPDQQKVFDALQRLQGPHGMHGGMGGRHMRMMMHGPGGPPMAGDEPD
jgi:protein CpxP